MLAGDCSMMMVMMVVTLVQVLVAVEAVTVTREQLRVASQDSRRLAEELATILDRITGDPGHTEDTEDGDTEDTEDGDTEDTEDGDTEDGDKVENILLQLEINQLEQELSRLALTTATTTSPSTTTTTSAPSHKSSQALVRGQTTSSSKAVSSAKLIKSAKSAKLSTSQLNRKKFRKMLERFYHGDHFKI